MDEPFLKSKSVFKSAGLNLNAVVSAIDDNSQEYYAHAIQM